MSYHHPGPVLLLVALALSCVAARGGVPHSPWQVPPLVHLAATAQSGAAQALDPTDTYRVALLKMKAHLNVARALMRRNAPDADHHLRGPLQEIYKHVAGELRERNATLTEDILRQLDRAAEGGSAQAIWSAVETAVTAVDNSLVRTGRMSRGSMLDISRVLFRTAVEDYRQAVSDHTVVDKHKYQSGAGYAALADALTRRVRTEESGTYKRLRDAVALLREAWPAVVPPRIANGPDAVAGWLAEVESALDAVGEQREQISDLGLKRGSFAAPVAVWCNGLACGAGVSAACG